MGNWEILFKKHWQTGEVCRFKCMPVSCMYIYIETFYVRGLSRGENRCEGMPIESLLPTNPHHFCRCPASATSINPTLSTTSFLLCSPPPPYNPTATGENIMKHKISRPFLPAISDLGAIFRLLHRLVQASTTVPWPSFVPCNAWCEWWQTSWVPGLPPERRVSEHNWQRSNVYFCVQKHKKAGLGG